MSQILISNLCPLNFVSKERAMLPNYHLRHFDSWLSNERVLDFEQAPPWQQKWQNNDICFLQVRADMDPIFVKLVDENDIPFVDLQMVPVKQLGNYIWLEAAMAFTNVPEGVYRVQIVAAGIPVIESECLHVAPSHPDTLLFKYSHNRNDKDILFESGIYFNLRVDGTISNFLPVGNRTIYIDTPNSPTTVKGISSRLFTLHLGNGAGVPDYIADKVQDIFDLRYVDIDGKAFSAATEGSKLTAKREEGYGFSGWTLDIAESLNRRSKIFDGEGVVDERVLIDYIVEGRLFGPTVGSANDNTYTINEIE